MDLSTRGEQLLNELSQDLDDGGLASVYPEELFRKMAPFAGNLTAAGLRWACHVLSAGEEKFPSWWPGKWHTGEFAKTGYCYKVAARHLDTLLHPSWWPVNSEYADLYEPPYELQRECEEARAVWKRCGQQLKYMHAREWHVLEAAQAYGSRFNEALCFKCGETFSRQAEELLCADCQGAAALAHWGPLVSEVSEHQAVELPGCLFGKKAAVSARIDEYRDGSVRIGPSCFETPMLTVELFTGEKIMFLAPPDMPVSLAFAVGLGVMRHKSILSQMKLWTPEETK